MLRKSLIVTGFAIFLGCGSSNTIAENADILRPASDAPESFSAIFATPVGDKDCQSRLVDPIDQVELILVKSFDGIGDYLVPPGKYRMSSDELLRINCRTGKVIGVVKK